ncbi:hypothetical protein HK097_007546 [Rhizophlyctis rosea]|uniref:Uncharacterized protein n=1 Tax=Rhizophlyctis rosea TaxID=64517 RepID=A0AAD5SCW0_9FUNG|nr:hypothetical protein HK097_007546 [Rhizophlyctis rosea]
MAQGAIKNAGASALKKQQEKKSLGPKRREGKHIAPKKRALVTQKNLQKKLSAKSISQTEKLMAARAGATGKLTIMKGIADKANAEQKEKAKKK